MRRYKDSDALIDFCFNGIGELIRPVQVRAEIKGLLKVLEERKPEIVIEIGTATGGTLFLFCRTAAANAKIISVDLPGGRFGGGYQSWRIPLYKAFKLPQQQLYLLRADSHNEDTLQRVLRILNGGKIDLLFIDGDHSYNGVKMDFEMFSPLVGDNGLIALHDIVAHPAEIGCEVDKLWKELKNKFESDEFVSNWSQRGYGIGILKWITRHD
jgi:predicted O-methyltransferase YrrM